MTTANRLAAAAIGIACCAAQTAFAQTVQVIQNTPTGWLVQNYVAVGNAPSVVDLWFTESLCANGLLQLPPTATQTDADRLIAMILTAKVSLKQVQIFYNYNGSTCLITSFGIPD
jgi:hypothetical protein